MLKKLFFTTLMFLITISASAEIMLYHGLTGSNIKDFPVDVTIPENTWQLKDYVGGTFRIIGTDNEHIRSVTIPYDADDPKSDNNNFYLDANKITYSYWICRWRAKRTFDYENPTDAVNTAHTNPYDNIYQTDIRIWGTPIGNTRDFFTINKRFMFHVKDMIPSYMFGATRQIPVQELIQLFFSGHNFLDTTWFYLETPENENRVADPNVYYAEQNADVPTWEKSYILVRGKQLASLRLVENWGDGNKFVLTTVTTDIMGVGSNEIKGYLTFKETPDYENPTDVNSDNSYEIMMTTETLEQNHPSAWGGVIPYTSSQAYRIDVTNVLEDGEVAAAPGAATQKKILTTSWATLKQR